MQDGCDDLHALPAPVQMAATEAKVVHQWLHAVTSTGVKAAQSGFVLEVQEILMAMASEPTGLV